MLSRFPEKKKHVCISINGDVYSQHTCVVACPLLQTAGWLWSPTPPSLGTVWLGRAAGEVPLCGQQIYTRGGCLSRTCEWVCAIVHDTALSLWLVVWPGASFSMKNRRWHTRWYVVPTCAVCVRTRNEWDPISPQKNKHQLSDHITVDNVTLLLPTCTFWATRQPTLFWFPACCKPAKTISSLLRPFSTALPLLLPVQRLIWVFFPADWWFQIRRSHGFILRSTLKSLPDYDIDHCCRSAVCTAPHVHPPSSNKSCIDSYTL